MAKQTDKITFKPMPEWVLERFKVTLSEEITTGIIKTVTDAFCYTKGWFSQKDCIPMAAIEYIDKLHTEGRLK